MIFSADELAGGPFSENCDNTGLNNPPDLYPTRPPKLRTLRRRTFSPALLRRRPSQRIARIPRILRRHRGSMSPQAVSSPSACHGRASTRLALRSCLDRPSQKRLGRRRGPGGRPPPIPPAHPFCSASLAAAGLASVRCFSVRFALLAARRAIRPGVPGQSGRPARRRLAGRLWPAADVGSRPRVSFVRSRLERCRSALSLSLFGWSLCRVNASPRGHASCNRWTGDYCHTRGISPFRGGPVASKRPAVILRSRYAPNSLRSDVFGRPYGRLFMPILRITRQTLHNPLPPATAVDRPGQRPDFLCKEPGSKNGQKIEQKPRTWQSWNRFWRPNSARPLY